MERWLAAVGVLLFFPFVAYVLWGPFAFFFASRSLVRRLRARVGRGAAAVSAFVVLSLIFLPVVAAEPVGDAIPVILPWWVALLGLWMGSGLEFSFSDDGSFVLAFFFLVVAACVVSSHAFSQRDARDESPHATTRHVPGKDQR